MSTTRSAPTAEESGRATPYRGARIAVGTRHGKQHQFSAAFAEVLGAELVTPPDLDTDQFGTFSGEHPRVLSALEAARAKAALAIEATGQPCGLASEASYGPLPGSGVPGHEEVLLFCDTVRGIEILEGYRSTAVPGSRHRVTRIEELPASLLEGLTRQAVIVRPEARFDGIIKGVTGIDDLRAAIAAAAADTGAAIVEPDLSAHHNPSRRLVLARLAERLAGRLATPCPACAAPGFGRVDAEPGLPCRVCAAPTGLPRSEIHACPACGHTRTRPVSDARADPRDCPDCNP